jgi:hypothetical protein
VLTRAATELRVLQEERRVLALFSSLVKCLVQLCLHMLSVLVNVLNLAWSSFYLFFFSLYHLQKVDCQTADAIDAFLMKLDACAKGEQAFTFVVDDPSGNSYIENP